MDVAELLRSFRRQAGLSQAELAERAHMSPAAIGALEQGSRRAPYRQTILLLANALELGPNDRAELEAAAQRARSRGLNKPNASRVTNLPNTLTSFIEREEIFEIEALIAKHRLVTITGSAGVGKTRSALEVARVHQADAMFVDISASGDRNLIVGELSTVFNISIADNADELATLACALRDRCCLIVIDNCEHVVSDVADIVQSLLAGCPAIRILATSREPLRLSGEVVYRLPSLETPPRDYQRGNESRAYPALELFITRTQAADARFVFATGDIAIAAEICRDLEGIPLAIELAAARGPTLGLTTLRSRLNDSTVPGYARNLPQRHQTMLAALSWSYDLLSVPEQRLLQRLSVFSRGFTLAAAESVCATPPLEQQDIAVYLEALVAKSLADVAHTEKQTRYSTLESVRSFGATRLVEAGETETTSRRHAAWIGKLADDVHSRRMPVPDALPELDNVRAAVQFGLSSSSETDKATAGRIIGGCRHLWFAKQRHPELRTLAESALDQIDEERHPAIVAVLLGALTSLVPNHQVELTAKRAIPLLERTGDYGGAAALSSLLALNLWHRGSHEEALATITSAALKLEAHGPADRMLQLLLNRAWINGERGAIDEARRDLKAFDRLFARTGDDGLNLFATRMTSEADVELAAGNLAASASLNEDIIAECRRRSSYGVEIANASVSLAACRLMQGNDADAEQLSRVVLDWWPHLRTGGYDQTFIETVAAIATIRGMPSLGAQLLGFVDADLERYEHLRSRKQRLQNTLLIKHLREGLTDSDLERYRGEGRALNRDDAYAALRKFLVR